MTAHNVVLAFSASQENLSRLAFRTAIFPSSSIRCSRAVKKRSSQERPKSRNQSLNRKAFKSSSAWHRQSRSPWAERFIRLGEIHSTRHVADAAIGVLNLGVCERGFARLQASDHV
jgi:hypothetical protein